VSVNYLPVPLNPTQVEGRHPHPIKVGLQTDLFIRASFDYEVTLGYIRAEFTKAEGAEERIRQLWLNRSWPDELWEHSKKAQLYCQHFLRNLLKQNSIISAVGHWDWFLRRQSEFVLWALETEAQSGVDDKIRRLASHIDQGSLRDQIGNLSQLTGCSFHIEETDLRHLDELGLLRNIGSHNRWEVDQKYLQRTKTRPESGGWRIGQYRTYSDQEWLVWQTALRGRATWLISKGIGERFRALPAYPGSEDVFNGI